MADIDNLTVNFRLNKNNLNSKALGDIYLKQFKEWSIPEFEEFEERLYGVERRKRRDLIVFPGGAIEAGTKHRAFNNGVGEANYHFGDTSENGKYTQTRRHTNMSLNGSFQQGDITIIKAIEFPVVFPATKPTTVVNGIITNPAAVTNATNYDAAIHVHNFPKAFDVRYYELGKIKADGRMEDFPMISGGVVGYAGATPGGIACNGLNPAVPLKKVRILLGNMAFHIEVEATQDYSLASYGVQYGQEVVLHTVEMESNNP